jgi:acyl carrier protein
MATTPQSIEASAVEHEILDIVRGLLRELGSDNAAQTVSLDSSFDRDLGLGSLERVELLLRCEARFKRRLPEQIAQQAETPAEWVRAVLDGNRARTPKGRYSIQQPSGEAPRASESATNWVEVLRHQAELDLDRVHIHLLDDLDATRGQDITYGQLLERASSVAAGLVAAGLRPNDTVAIMLPTCADFFYAFVGVMFAGGIAVPIYPPARPDKIEEYVRRQILILRNAGIRFLITFDQVKAISHIMRASIPSLAVVTTVEALSHSATKLPTISLQACDTFFIQYTSGSTGDPKGVVLTHGNVLSNVRGIGWAVQVRPTDIVVSWLPLYHDMGLIGSWLFSVYYALPITILSPVAFLSRPERWLWALHDSRATLCPAPNFAYELCARKIPDQKLEGLDLSPWRVAINAGEAVLPQTLTRFAERFRRYGFRPESFVPCYGLAESSVALTFPLLGRRPLIDAVRRDVFEAEGRAVAADPDDPTASRFVANGRPLPNHEVRIVDDTGRELGERAQGRLLFRGPSKTPGYFRNPQATAAAVTEDGWMDSGDLAYTADGELYITGRSKDLIIKSGRNIIPQEVEAAAAEVQGVRRGCVAAFGTIDQKRGTERLVVVAETRATAPEELRRIEVQIMRTVDAAIGMPPDQAVLVAPHTIPKTSSGKIRRKEVRSLYDAGRLNTARRPPWFQMLCLGCESLGSGMGSGLKHVGARLRELSTQALVFAVGTSAGLVIRFASQPVRARIARLAARSLLKLSGQRVTVRGSDLIAREGPAVFVANRAGVYDPLALASRLRSRLLFADGSTLSSLPWGARFVLEPLLVAPLNGATMPPGGTLRQRLCHALERGHSVLVFPDGPIGAPAHLSRFRLDAFHAALATGTPIIPVAVRK